MLTREQILKKTKDKPWVSPFEKIVGIYNASDGFVQIYEYHARNACFGAAAWAVYHYHQTSPLIINAVRDGARDIFTLKLGRADLDLKPSYSSAGIEAVELVNEKIHITYSGLAGGGVGSSFCRALAKDVAGVEILAEGGGDRLGRAKLILPEMTKIHVGVDDTDKPGAGATWSLANEIGYFMGKRKGVEYINHTLVQLYPSTPEKTTNCVSTVLTFAVKPEKIDKFKLDISKRFHDLTSSEQTGLAFYSGISFPSSLIQYSENARTNIVKLEETKTVAEETGVELRPITGNRGLIGAVAGIAYSERHEQAVKPAV